MNKTALRDRDLIEAITRSTGRSASRIAAEIGVSPSTFTRVLTGHNRLSVSTLEKLEKAFPEFFGGMDEIADSDHGDYVEIEVLPSYGGMGGGGFGDGEPGRALVPRRLVVERLRAQAADLLMIDVRGDSMTGMFEHGDQILIDKRDCDPSQPGPFALWDGDTYVVKLVERVPGQRGRFRIFSVNERYSAYEVDAAETRFVGRPVWFGRAI